MSEESFRSSQLSLPVDLVDGMNNLPTYRMFHAVPLAPTYRMFVYVPLVWICNPDPLSIRIFNPPGSNELNRNCA
jgi:hypothetical protein